jgi:hypothetical protein
MLNDKNMIIKFQKEKINLQGEQISGLEAQLKEVKYQASLAKKNNKQGKRKALKVEKMGRLIMFPVKKKVSDN